MDKFIIDRQQGQAIWIDVKRGKVRRCYNGGETTDARLNELYKGKSITFLREDFENRMADTYCNVRPEAILMPKKIIHAVKQRIVDCNVKICMIEKTIYHQEDQRQKAKEEVKILRSRRDDLKHDLFNAEVRLQAEIDRIAKQHKFETQTTVFV